MWLFLLAGVMTRTAEYACDGTQFPDDQTPHLLLADSKGKKAISRRVMFVVLPPFGNKYTTCNIVAKMQKKQKSVHYSFPNGVSSIRSGRIFFFIVLIMFEQWKF